MKYVLSLLIFFAAVLNVNAQTGDKLLKQLQDKFWSIQDLSADFSQNMQKNGASGKLYYKKGNKYDVELKGTRIVSDGSTVWNYNTRNKKVVINDVRDTSSPFSLENIIVNYPRKSTVESLGRENLGGTEYNVLRLNSKSDRNFKTARIWFNDSNFIRRVEVTDAQGAKYSFELSNIKINQNLNSNRFTFHIPQGTEVIDLR